MFLQYIFKKRFLGLDFLGYIPLQSMKHTITQQLHHLYLLNNVNFLSADKDSSLVNGKSYHLALDILTCVVLPNTSRYDGALSMAWLPTMMRTPTMVVVLLVLLISIVKPPVWNEKSNQWNLFT